MVAGVESSDVCQVRYPGESTGSHLVREVPVPEAGVVSAGVPGEVQSVTECFLAITSRVGRRVCS